MAIQLSSHRCDDCSGKLVFNKEKKRFECPYCGKIFEQDFFNDSRLKIDGLAGIQQTVRSTLIAISKLNFDSASDQLMECEKLEHEYVGTYLANIAYYFFRGSYDSSLDKNVANARITHYRETLLSEYPNILDDEKGLYDFLDESDLYALLYTVYLALHLEERASFIAHFIDFDQINNPYINKRLLPILCKAAATEELSQIIHNIAFIDKKFTLFYLLKEYPSNEQKLEWVQYLLDNKSLETRDQKLMDKYFEETQDSYEIQSLVAIKAKELSIHVDLPSLLKKLLTESTPDKITFIFERISSLRLIDEDTNKIVDSLFGPGSHQVDVILTALETLKKGKSLYEITSTQLLSMLGMNTLSKDDYIRVLTYLYDNFKITERSTDMGLRYTLNHLERTVALRVEVNLYLLSKITALSIEALTSYLNNCVLDGEKKITILEKVFQLKMNPAYFSSLLNQYVLIGKDEAQVKIQVILFLLSQGLKVEEKGCEYLLTNLPIPKELEEYFQTEQIAISNQCVNLYIANLNQHPYSTILMQKLLSHPQKVTTNTIEKYLFYIQESLIVKKGILQTLLKYSSSDFTPEKYSLFGESIQSNIAQKYLLLSNENPQDIEALIPLLTSKGKLPENMLVSGKKISFKKFVMQKKDEFSKEKVQIFEDLGVFKLFF